MALTELPFIPGVIKDEEPYSARGAATDSQLIRWVRGSPEVLGGWTQILSGIQGTVRAMHEWTLTDGRAYVAIATSQKLYVFDGTRLFNITPLRTETAVVLPSGPIATTIGSSTVTLTTSAGHGMVVGDTVYLNGLSAVAGLTIGGASYPTESNPITTLAGSRLVKITKTANGFSDDDVVVIDPTSGVGGLTAGDLTGQFRPIILTANTFQIEVATAATSTATGGGTTIVAAGKDYIVTAVPSATTFRIDAGANANAPTTGGGAAGSFQPEITIGRESTLLSGGFGSGTFGLGAFGTGASEFYSKLGIPLRQWSLDNFGNTLVACLSGGTGYNDISPFSAAAASIFVWPGSNPVLGGGILAYASVLQNAPAQVTCVVTTPERFLLACGCTNEDDDFDPLLVRHSTGEDPTVWVAASDNSAGDFPVSGGSRIVGAIRRETGPMIFTDGGLNAVRTVGAADQIYKADQIGVDCGLLGLHAATQRDGDLYWLSPAYQVYVYRGGRPVALECPLREWFEDRVGKLHFDKIFAWPDRRFEAVSFHYAANDAVEPGDYIRLDVPEARRDPKAGWSVGTMDRTAASAGYVFNAKKPLAVSSAGVLYQHEDGFSDNGAARDSFVQWAPIDLSDGQTRAGVTRVQADMTQTEDVLIHLGFREWPRGPASTRELTVTSLTQKNDTRGGGRQVDMRISFTGTTYWRAGAIRFDLVESSRR